VTVCPAERNRAARPSTWTCLSIVKHFKTLSVCTRAEARQHCPPPNCTGRRSRTQSLSCQQVRLHVFRLHVSTFGVQINSWQQCRRGQGSLCRDSAVVSAKSGIWVFDLHFRKSSKPSLECKPAPVSTAFIKKCNISFERHYRIRLTI
jgi:hypothetical protein